jgi:hypothetical protein
MLPGAYYKKDCDAKDKTEAPAGNGAMSHFEHRERN